MEKHRLEAFTDCVMSIIITIMALGFKVPKDPTLDSYLEMWPVFISYTLSFLFVGLNWASHHHLFQKVLKIDNNALWINMFNLFVISFIPFATSAMGESSFKSITVAIYASLLTISVIVYLFQVIHLCKLHGKNSIFYNTFKGHKKTYFSIVLNISAIIISVSGFPKISVILLIITSFSWFIPNHIFEDNNLKDINVKQK